jgi:hypothetical protein
MEFVGWLAVMGTRVARRLPHGLGVAMRHPSPIWDIYRPPQSMGMATSHSQRWCRPPQEWLTATPMVRG